MKLGILAIYDFNDEYANNLMEYISSKQGIPFRTMVFTQREPLFEYVLNNRIDLLLTGEMPVDEDIRNEKNIKNIMLLRSDNVFTEDTEYFSVYKYQSADNLIREVLEYYAEVHSGGDGLSVPGQGADIIGVYSPVARCGQTTFALTLGQVLASDNSVLYINMEEFAAFDKIFGTTYTGDLSDLMYFFKQNRESLPIKLQAVVRNINGLDYVPPLVYSSDLRNISTQEWIDLISVIAGVGDYDKVILDLGNMVQDVFAILEICNQIYMPVRDDMISDYKLAACEEYLLKSGREELAGQMIKVQLPQFDKELQSINYYESLLWGRMGDFVRRLINEEA